MLFALDVGNTVITVGLFKGPDLTHHWRISTDRHKTEDEYGILFLSLLNNAGVKPGEARGAILASVVPPLTGALETAVKRYLGLSPLIVGPGTKTGINVKYENPKEVGPDRIVNAVAAFRKYGGPAIVVDFGTATIFDAISKEGDYLGGAIAPGIFTSTDALFEKAAKLTRIELTKPGPAIGRTTADSMRSGILYGFAAQNRRRGQANHRRTGRAGPRNRYRGTRGSDRAAIVHHPNGGPPSHAGRIVLGLSEKRYRRRRIQDHLRPPDWQERKCQGAAKPAPWHYLNCHRNRSRSNLLARRSCPARFSRCLEQPGHAAVLVNIHVRSGRIRRKTRHGPHLAQERIEESRAHGRAHLADIDAESPRTPLQVRISRE